MTVWLVRAGKHGEFEQKFLQENRIYVTWDHLAVDIGKMTERKQLFDAMTKAYPDAKVKAIHNNVSQVWPFAHGMEKGAKSVACSIDEFLIVACDHSLAGGRKREKPFSLLGRHQSSINHCVCPACELPVSNRLAFRQWSHMLCPERKF